MQLFIVAAALFAGLTVCQDLSIIQNLPQCGQTCINNMLGQAVSLGCSSNTDIACLCKNMDFGFGVRDCSTVLCREAKPPVDPAQIISAGNSFCAQAGSGSTATVAQTAVTGTTAVSAGTTSGASSGTGSSNGTSTSGSTGGSAGNGTSSGLGGTNSTSGTTGTNGTSSTNGTSGGLLGGGSVVTTTNSVGSTTTSTMASSSSSGSASSSSSSSSSSVAPSGGSGGSSTTSSGKSEATHLAAGGFVGLAGLAAFALL